MITYIVAGSSTNKNLATLENLCSKVKKNYQNINFKIIAKHENDWEEYIKQICKIYGFKHKTDPICFTPQGELIGNHTNFEKMLEEKYSINSLKINPLDETNAQTNDKIANEDYDYRHRIVTLKEKVKQRFERLLFRDKFELNKEIFEEIDLGIYNVYIKYLERYTPQLIIDTNVITSDEYLQVHENNFDILEAFEKDKQRIEEEQPENPKTKVTNTSKISAQDEGDTMSRVSKSAKNSRTNESPKDAKLKTDVSDQIIEEEQEDNVNGEEEKEKTDAGEEEEAEEEEKGPTTEDLNRIQQRKDCLDSLANLQPIEFNLREWIVEKFDQKYYLAIHPESVFDCHSMVLRGDKIDWNRAFAKETKEMLDRTKIENEAKPEVTGDNFSSVTKSKTMPYYDFSKVQKIRVVGDVLKEVYEQEGEVQGTMSNIYSRFYDACQPFSMQDLTLYLQILKDLDAYGFYRVLPQNFEAQNSFMNFTFHVIMRESFLKVVNNLKNSQFRAKELDFEIFLDNIKENLTSEFDLRKRRETKKGLENEKLRLIQEEEERIQFLKDMKKKREEEERLARLENENPPQPDIKKKATMKGTPNSSVKMPSRQGTMALQNSELDMTEVKEGEEEAGGDKVAQSEGGEETKVEQDGSPKFSASPSNFGDMVNDMVEEEIEYKNPLEDKFYRVNNWNFPHKIYFREKGETPEKVMDVLEHMNKSLEKEEGIDLTKIGFNFVLSEKYIIMIPILTPYMDYGGNKLYLEPWSYLGFFTIPKLEKLWPATKTIKTATSDFKIQNPTELYTGINKIK